VFKHVRGVWIRCCWACTVAGALLGSAGHACLECRPQRQRGLQGDAKRLYVDFKCTRVGIQEVDVAAWICIGGRRRGTVGLRRCKRGYERCSEFRDGTFIQFNIKVGKDAMHMHTRMLTCRRDAK
jgi:hypothetical protein